VENHTGTAVSLRVHRAEARRPRGNDLLAELPRGAEALPEEVLIRHASVEGPQPRDDLRTRRIRAVREDAAGGVDDLREAVGAVALRARDGAREEPGVPSPNRLVAAGPEAQTDHRRVIPFSKIHPQRRRRPLRRRDSRRSDLLLRSPPATGGL